MNPFFESFLKELGSGLAKTIWIGLIILSAVAGFSLPRDMTTARVILLCLAVLLILALSIFLVYRYQSNRRKKNESKKDNVPGTSIAPTEILVVSDLHHPDLREHAHSKCVLWCSIVNKSGRMVTINKVLAFDSANRLLPITWSSRINEVGNPLNPSGLIGIKETETLYLRHNHGSHFFYCKLKIHHSLSDKPTIKIFDELSENDDGNIDLQSADHKKTDQLLKISPLDSTQVEILKLLFSQNMSTEQIADSLGLQLQTATYHLEELTNLNMIILRRYSKPITNYGYWPSLQKQHFSAWTLKQPGRKYLLDNKLVEA